MINKLPCGKCTHYDPRLGPNYKDTKMGQCVKRSWYPFEEGPGQIFPPTARRVAAGELAKPYMVKADQIVGSCTFVKESSISDAAKAKRQVTTDSLMTNSKGQKVLT